MTETAALERWRKLALRFHAVADLVAQGRLPRELEPGHLIDLPEPASVAGFLLHVWNDRDHRFDLSEVRGWDGRHLAALVDWVTGRATGEPCRYFTRDASERKDFAMNVTHPHCELIPVSSQVARFCAALRNYAGETVAASDLLEGFLVCIEHQVTRPGSWEASLGRDFLQSFGYVVVDGWRGGI